MAAEQLRLKEGTYVASRPALGLDGRANGTYTLRLGPGDALPPEYAAHLPEADRSRFRAVSAPGEEKVSASTKGRAGK